MRYCTGKVGIMFGRLALISARLGLNLPFWICPSLYISVPFLSVCCCFSAFLTKMKPNSSVQPHSFPSSQIIWLFLFDVTLEYKFLAALCVECNIQFFGILFLKRFFIYF